MSVYCFHDLALTVGPPELEAVTGFGSLCSSLAWWPERGETGNGRRHLTLRLHGRGAGIPDDAIPRFWTEGFGVFEGDGYSYVGDGATLLRVRMDRFEADAFLDESFFEKPRTLQWHFWSFCILKLMRPAGYFSLHAAAVVSPGGAGMLMVGPSGSGKTTLAVGLIRAGWRYLSDDAVLVRQGVDAMSVVALRTQFYVDASAAPSYVDLRLGHEVDDAAGSMRRELHIDDRHGDRRVAEAAPRVLLFPRIVDAEASAIGALDHVAALRNLLSASGPQLFDRMHMSEHLAALRSIVGQCVSYGLEAGRDLHRNPARVLELIPCGRLH